MGIWDALERDSLRSRSGNIAAPNKECVKRLPEVFPEKGLLGLGPGWVR